MNWHYVTAVRMSATGGQTTHILESCKALAKRRPATLIAPGPPPQPIPGMALHLVPMPDRPPRELIYQARVARAMTQLGRKKRPGVIYIRAAAFNLGALLAARKLGAVSILELNGLPALEFVLERGGQTARARALAYGLMARLDMRLASGIVAVTPQLAHEARTCGARQIYIASNGVNPALFTPGDQQAARQILGLPAEANVIGFVGNFAAWQGLETLVGGMLLLHQRRPTLRLLLIGDGVERARLETLAAPLGESVIFTGALPHNQVGALLSACDILAAPLAPGPRNTRTGVSPLKVFEYLALGKPVLASGLPGLEFIEHERLGMLFTPGDPASLAERLEALLQQSPDERAATSIRARSAAEQRYSWDTITEGIIAYAERLR